MYTQRVKVKSSRAQQRQNKAARTIVMVPIGTSGNEMVECEGPIVEGSTIRPGFARLDLLAQVTMKVYRNEDTSLLLENGVKWRTSMKILTNFIMNEKF